MNNIKTQHKPTRYCYINATYICTLFGAKWEQIVAMHLILNTSFNTKLKIDHIVAMHFIFIPFSTKTGQVADCISI